MDKKELVQQLRQERKEIQAMAKVEHNINRLACYDGQIATIDAMLTMLGSSKFNPHKFAAFVVGLSQITDKYLYGDKAKQQ